MSKKNQLSLLLVLALHVKADELKEITISATQEESVFSSQKYENTQEIRNTLPSNMISSANTSGIKIDGATSDFTSIYWNGIKVIDPSSINAYPTFMNYGRNSSENLSVDGSRINYSSSNENALELQIGENSYSKARASAMIETENTTHNIKAEDFSNKNRSAYSNERKTDSSEEKDRESNFAISYLSRLNLNDTLNSKIAYMYKSVLGDYDGGYPTDPNDSSAKFDTLAHVGGVDFGYLQNHNELKADLQYTATDTEHQGAYPSEADSEVLRFGLKGATDLGIENLLAKASLYSVKEKAKIRSAFTNADEERDYNDYALSLGYTYENILLNLAYNSSYKETNSYLATLKVPIISGFSLLAKYELSGVNPTIIQETNPYGASNDDLKSQNLERISGGLLYEEQKLTCKLEYSQIKTDDMIVWVSDPVSYVGQYQNVETSEYNFLRAVLDYNFLEDFALNIDYSNISNITSSNEALLYNLPEHKAIAKLEYFSIINAYFLASYSSEQSSYSGDVDAATTYNLGLGYNVNERFEVRADIYNITDEYVEYVKHYPESGRIISAGINYTF
ncbi:MAG: TonB-dependent receptor [Campylobacterota bacterium]|nr:TonB-dependent receptor [Campylobacterota bacterium]